MRNLNQMEVEMISGGVEPVPPPPPGVTQEQWNDLLFRLEWERKNPYRREN